MAASVARLLLHLVVLMVGPAVRLRHLSAAPTVGLVVRHLRLPAAPTVGQPIESSDAVWRRHRRVLTRRCLAFGYQTSTGPLGTAIVSRPAGGESVSRMNDACIGAGR